MLKISSDGDQYKLKDFKYLEELNTELKINPSTTALLVLDMQNGFAHDTGSFSKHGRNITLIKKAIPTIKSAARYYRSQGIPVIYTRQVNPPEFISEGLHECVGREVSEWKPAKTYPCLKGTWDAEIVDALKPTKNDVVIEKNRTNAFIGTWLELWLRHRKVKTVLITGCTTGMCVAHTAMDAYARDYDVVVVEDGVGDQDPIIHSSILQLLDRRFGRVLWWNKVKEILGAYPKAVRIKTKAVTAKFKIIPDSQKTYLKLVR